MEKHKIIVPKGIRYIGDWKDFDLENYEGPYIINKTLTGCGFTEHCLTNDKDIVLISPRRFLLENKEEQHPGDVYYFRNDNEVSVDFELDIEKDDVKAIQEKAEETEDSKNKTLENLDRIKRNLGNTYLTFKHDNPDKPFKILVTYDSFKHVKNVLKDLKKEGSVSYFDTDKDSIVEAETEFDNFFCVVDEFQSIFIDARFKSEAEITLLKELDGCKRLCFVSATPMLDKYLEMLKEFKDLPYYELDWSAEDPGRVVKPKIEIKFTKSLNEEARMVVNSYKNGKYDVRIDPDTKEIIESREAVLFFNSVAGICQVIRTNKLHLEDCNIICADTSKNKEAVKKALNSVLKKEAEEKGLTPKYFTKNDKVIGKIPVKGEPHKMFTFCTRTVYLGADFYSTNARSFIFSDANIDCLSVDISMDLEQILGRQRLLINPWKDYAKVFIRTLSKKNTKTEGEFKKRLNTKIKKTENLLASYTEVDPSRRKDLAENYLTVAKMCHYRNDYVSVRVEKDWETKKIISMTPEFNELMMISDMRAFEVQQVDYKDRFTVFSAVNQSGIEGATIKSCELVEEFNHYGDTTSRLKMLVQISEDKSLTSSDIGAFLEMIPPKYKDYYLIVGPDIIRACGCFECEVKKRWRKEVEGDDYNEQVISRMGDMFRIGHKYSKSGIKESLKKLYQELDYKKTAKATDLEVIYVTKAIKLQEDGKWVNGFEILGKRYTLYIYEEKESDER